MSKELIDTVISVRISVIKKNPPEYLIEAEGENGMAGWLEPELEQFVYVQPPPDGIWDYNFQALPPEVGAAVITRINADKALTKMPKGFRGVRVHARSNKKEALLGES